jgi:hypothetical protein
MKYDACPVRALLTTWPGQPQGRFLTCLVEIETKEMGHHRDTLQLMLEFWD